jgi:DNA-binding FadR family transcriptional regulator
MQYTQIKTGRLADQVSNQLKKAILHGEYQTGEKMPTEHQLVAIFGVSRVIIREAIRNLERSGLIEIKRGPKGGAFVQPVRHDAVSQIIQDLFKRARGTVDDIMEVRLEIEPIVAGLAAERATKDDIRMLKEALEGMPGPPSREYVAANVNFHRHLAACAHNPIYHILVNILMDFTEELILKIKPENMVFHDTVSHAELLQLVSRKDAVNARRKMRSHLEDIVPVLKDAEIRYIHE